jgi:hypothetical protein
MKPLLSAIIALALAACSSGTSGTTGGTSGGTSGTSSGTGGTTSGTSGGTWQTSYLPGGDDSAGNLMEGTELRALVPFEGALYAGIGYWEDTEGFATNTPDPNLPGAQVLRLDSPDGGWQVELQLTQVVETGPWAGQRVHFAIAALQALTLTTDSSGQPLSPPVQVLAAATWSHSAGLNLFVRTADDATWVQSILGPGGQGNEGRAFATHLDGKTHVSTAFTGSDVGIFSGQYDADAGTIDWAQTAEAWYSSGIENDTPPTDAGWRVMAFSDCGGSLYATVGPSIYQRQDGPSPVWKTVYTASFPPGYDFQGNGGLRGAHCLPGVGDAGSTLLMGKIGGAAQIIDVDPSANFAVTVDQNLISFLTSAWGFPVTYVLQSYSDMTPATDPVTGEQVLLIGFEATAPMATVPVWDSGAALFIASANYLVRHANGSYDVHTVDDPSLGAPHATRTLAISPFPSDHGAVVYAGGYDCDQAPSHNTAWAAKAPLGVALGH